MTEVREMTPAEQVALDENIGRVEVPQEAFISALRLEE